MPTAPARPVIYSGRPVPLRVMQELWREFTGEQIASALHQRSGPLYGLDDCSCSTCRIIRRFPVLLAAFDSNPDCREMLAELTGEPARRLSEVPPVTLGDMARLSDADIAEFSASMRGPEVTFAPGALRSNPASPSPDQPTPEPIVNTTTEKPLATTVLPTDAVIFKLCRDLSARLERREGYSNVRYCVQADFHKARGFVRLALFEMGSPSGTADANQYEYCSFGYIDRLTGDCMANIGRPPRGNISDPRLVECFTHYGFVPSPVITSTPSAT